MRLKLPHYHVDRGFLDSLARRFEYSLMALDEIGIQYNMGPNNNTKDTMLYHFNYLITLITGIFDNLALKTKNQLTVDIDDFRGISLSSSSGKKFLKMVKKSDPKIRSHIQSYSNFIKLIYLFRESVIHREPFPDLVFEYCGKDIHWKANFIKIPTEINERIRDQGDQELKYDPFSRWGRYQSHDDYFLDPYHFSISCILTLIAFIDKYLELLGYPSFVEERKKEKSNFTHTLKHFEEYHLGF